MVYTRHRLSPSAPKRQEGRRKAVVAWVKGQLAWNQDIAHERMTVRRFNAFTKGSQLHLGIYTYTHRKGRQVGHGRGERVASGHNKTGYGQEYEGIRGWVKKCILKGKRWS